ncbi:Glutamyl-tRNA(Gln) amidotransferase subunit A [Achromobacter spanius]|uniref:amidase family protein n=1 Tax=Achromobacter spanius TaxID=217203 RepID=UPI000C2C16AF|nr:amidase family protein [Achromobacter spanius]AUA59164.1 amidase [Achromobacter spanius]CAB3705731.1 Acylamidase [Achromobacter spanius]SPT40598.1 Glutamyl-tRNA(Gln) amidotransferase subunit A [Achromobacter denitrificans]VEE58646.1 Glutamyl-tRNA(Gln) amidotransferase subunit A [Achromobacter spanius]
MSDLWRLSAVELASRIRNREVSAVEAAQSALERLNAVNLALNAVVDHRPDEVMARAAAVDAQLARGEDPGVLAGVPVTVKVNVDQAGYATTNGVKLQKDLIAATNSPVVDNLLRAGAVILGRTNTPAFSLRWFTGNALHGDTRNPRNAALTPGGSSGGAASAVAAGIGHLAHGTDIAGSIRYPAYACGVHGLRPSLGRVAAYNAALPERSIGGQLTAVSGPLGRTIADVRLGLAVLAAPDPRDPWWVPAPLVGPDVPRRAALCVNPDGMDTEPAVVKALQEAARRLTEAGWTVDTLDAVPPMQEAADLQVRMWMADGYDAMVAAAEKEGDQGALVALRGQRDKAAEANLNNFSAVLTRRATLTRMWEMFLADYPILLLPVSAELPFPDKLDLQGDAAYARVWRAQMTQIGVPFMGLPGLSVAMGQAMSSVGQSPVGVQIVAGRYREDLCLAAGEIIEAGGDAVTIAEPQSR